MNLWAVQFHRSLILWILSMNNFNRRKFLARWWKEPSDWVGERMNKTPQPWEKPKINWANLLWSVKVTEVGKMIFSAFQARKKVRIVKARCFNVFHITSRFQDLLLYSHSHFEKCDILSTFYFRFRVSHFHWNSNFLLTMLCTFFPRKTEIKKIKILNSSDSPSFSFQLQKHFLVWSWQKIKSDFEI